jgi:UDP-galactopyranose mutase
MYDYVIVGSGLFGSIFANILTQNGKKCLVLEKRNHIGGNCYTEKIENISVHKYGAHIFHTNNEKVWEFMNKFVKFNNYRHHVLANYKNELYSLPFNMFTFNKLWGINNPNQAIEKIKSERYTGEITNLKEQSLSLVGKEIFEKFIEGYTEKQWLRSCEDLPPSIIKRIPVRYTYDNNYFFDKYQGIPENGYTELFEKLLRGIEIRINTDFFSNRKYFESIGKKVVYTGPIDKFYNYEYGYLEYRPLEFKHKVLSESNFQGHSVINYSEKEIPFTRIIEHKHFNNDISDKTIITEEYPIEWEKNSEPYYPINDLTNQEIYEKYKNKMIEEDNIIFGGRLAEYKYYDMDKVVESALFKSEEEIKKIQ